MENELNADCTVTRDFINRLARAELVTDEETAQIIFHTGRCEGCKTYLNDTLQAKQPADGDQG